MGASDWGNQPIWSTGVGRASNPSTTTLVAEIDSTQLQTITGSSIAGAGRSVVCRVTAIVGASTLADWTVEQALSTGLGSTAVRQLVPILTPSGQSGQYVFGAVVEPGDRIRARLNSSFTGNANAFLQVEPLS